MIRRALTTLAVAAVALGVAALPAAASARHHRHHAKAADRNHDGLPDRWEHRYGLSLKANQASRDQDHDGLVNKTELQSGTSPRDADSDDDGVSDANEDRDHDGLCNRDEQRTGNDAGDDDTDNDGRDDGEENAGTVQSFDQATGMLVIKLANNELLSGKVDQTTELSCRTLAAPAPAPTASSAGDDGDHEDGDREGGDGEHHDGAPAGSCGTDKLVMGTAVHEAELKGTSSGAVFEEVKLLIPAG